MPSNGLASIVANRVADIFHWSLVGKVVLGEFQRAAIFADGADGLLGEAVGHGRLDFDGHIDVGHELADEVLNHLT